jgi:two-component system, chemotaxis family, response regulator Rcp1
MEALMLTLSREPIQILLVEDSPSDAELTTDALRATRVANEVHRVSDGVEALRYLRRQAEYDHAPPPDLILLDLNLPRMSGHELLEQIKGDDALDRIPVIVLTTSYAERDVLRSYQLRANCYVSKPVALQAFLDVVQQLGDFWLQVARLPQG